MAVDVQVIQLRAPTVMAAWVTQVLTDPLNWASLPDRARNLTQVEATIARAIHGRTVIYVTLVDDELAGMFIGNHWEAGLWGVHQYSMPAGRGGLLPVITARAALQQAWNDVPACQRMMGRTPATHTAALAVARRLGFRECGRLTGEWIIDGRPVDCVLTSLERCNE